MHVNPYWLQGIYPTNIIVTGGYILKKEVFISYSHIDTQWATWIAGVLEHNGFTVFVGAWDLRPGDDFVTKTKEFICNADVFMPILSDEYMKSIYCKAELSMALEENISKIKIIPIRVSEVATTSLLSNIIYVDLYCCFDRLEAENRLISALDEQEIARTLPDYPGANHLKDTEYPGDFPINNLPTNKKLFWGREQSLREISTIFEKNSILQITGCAGIGKTKLALAYAHICGKKYKSGIWYVSGADKKIILSEFIIICKKVGIEVSEDCNEIEVQGKIQNWFVHHKDWLLIVDNLISYETIASYLPTNVSGNILITTREKILNIGEVLQLDALSEEDAVAILRSYLADNSDDELKLLAEKLEYFPFALKQAGTYILDSGISVSEFIKIINSKAFRDNNQPNTMSRIEQLFYSKLSREAKQLLNLCAYMYPYKIPFALFTRNRNLLPEPLKSVLNEEFDFAKLLSELKLYSFITEDNQEFNIFPYHQNYLRTHEESLKWLDICLKIALSDIPKEYEDWEAKERFFTIAEHVYSIAECANLYYKGQAEKKKTIFELYYRMGYGFYKTDEYDKSLNALNKALDLVEDYTGDDYFDIITVHNNIAQIFVTQRKYENAIKHYQKVLNICESNKGDELSIAQIYVNIASVYCKTHNYQVALRLYKNALAIQERLLGINHPTTASTIENIASVHYNLSNLSESLDWHYRALNILTNTLGENHPDIANILNNIGVILDDQGKYNEALEYYHKALIIFEKVFGRDNADTAQAYNNIALNYSNRGEHQKALEWYKKALLIFSNVFGTTHPLTVTIKRNIKKLNRVCKDKKTSSKNEVLSELPLQSANNLPNPEISSFTEWYTSLSSEDKPYNDNEFRQFLNDLYSSIKKIKEDSEFFINNNSPELCQYTKLSTLKFLVRSEIEKDEVPIPKFRLSNIAYLNDPSEGQVFIDLLNYFVKSPIFDDIFGKSSEKRNGSLTEFHLNNVYIGSFSTFKNKLPMWTLYGDNSNGCCIVFDNSFFTGTKGTANLDKKDFEQSIRLYRVQYLNIREPDKINDNILRSLREIAESIERWYKIVIQNSKLIRWISNILDEIRFLFKCDDYSYEDEVRLILRDDKVNRPFVDRTTNGVPKLYINVNNPIALKEVILGSKVENPSEPAQFLLFSGVKKVTLSDITYR